VVWQLTVWRGVACVLALGGLACADGDERVTVSGGRCAELASKALIDFDIVRARPVPADAESPAHCQVQGLIGQDITFELWLPDEWNGQFLMAARGAEAGVTGIPTSGFTAGAEALERGYATLAGNGAQPPVYSTAEAALSITQHYYGRAATLTPGSLPWCEDETAAADCVTTAQRAVLEGH